MSIQRKTAAAIAFLPLLAACHEDLDSPAGSASAPATPPTATPAAA